MWGVWVVAPLNVHLEEARELDVPARCFEFGFAGGDGDRIEAELGFGHL